MMAVGYLNTPATQTDNSSMFLNVKRQRRNGLADIFCGNTSDEVCYLKRRFLKLYDSCSSVSDMESGCESDLESEPVDLVFELENELSINGEESDSDSGTHEAQCDDEISETTCERASNRRLALADIFEGVPEDNVNDFLSRYSEMDTEDNCGQENIKHSQRKRRFALANIYEGLSEECVARLHNFVLPEDNEQSETSEVPSEEYFCRRRNGLPDIFQDVDKTELSKFLGHHTCDNDSITQKSDCESVESDCETSDITSDTAIKPAVDYLWRRRCALANIFDGTSVSEIHIRAQ